MICLYIFVCIGFILLQIINNSTINIIFLCCSTFLDFIDIITAIFVSISGDDVIRVTIFTKIVHVKWLVNVDIWLCCCQARCSLLWTLLVTVASITVFVITSKV